VVGYSPSSAVEGSVSGLEVSRNFKRKTESIQTVSVITQIQPTTTVFKIDEKYTLETDGKTTTIGINNLMCHPYTIIIQRQNRSFRFSDG